MKIEQYLNKLKRRIDYILDKQLPKDKSILSQAMRYYVFPGGKRLRPILTISSAQLVGGRVEDALLTACAIELIHNFALIHDDLPCMDDDDYRRNKPACHKIFGEAIAILAGDALLNHAFKLVSKDRHIPPPIAIKVLKETCKGIGLGGLIGGQALEMWYRKAKRKINLYNLTQIYNRKTAALICSAVKVGAIIGGANKKELSLLTRYGINIGFAYQIMDDILEFINGEMFNKVDEPNYLTFFSLDEVRHVIEEKIEKAKISLSYFGTKAEILIAISDYILNKII